MPAMLSGVFPALTSPFDHGRLSVGHFVKNIESYNNHDLSGYVVLGSTGETILLDDSERLSLVRAACSHAGNNKKIIVGSGRESTRATIEFTNRAAELGVDAALVITPFYYRGQMTADVLSEFYVNVADNADIPILLYNVPKFTGLQLPLETVKQTMTHPNITGIKDSSGSLGYFEEIVNMCPQDFSVLQGSGSVEYASFLVGAHGAILALADIAPRETTAIYEAVKSGDLELGKKMQLSMAPVNNKIVGMYGVPGIKYALDLLGFYGGEPRLPLAPVSDETRNVINRVLMNAGMLKAA